MNYSESELRKLQEISIDILEEFIRICEKHNLVYFAAFGTAIGAVRHEGFIPWDDDMDVIMPRPDYDKFIEIARYEMDERYGLAGAEIQKKIQGFYLQMYRKGTVWMTKWNERWEEHVGIKLDIFPYDCIPADNKERKKLYLKTRILNFLYIIRNVKTPYDENRGAGAVLTRMRNYCIYGVLRICHISREWLAEKYTGLMTSYEGKSEYRTLINWSNPDKWVILENEIWPLQECRFDRLTIKLPAKNHEILMRQYGDYMTPPPKVERVTHNLAILDFGDL